MSELLRAIHEWLFTARCQGCPNRVRIIGSVWLGTRRRESAYCNACRSLDMVH